MIFLDSLFGAAPGVVSLVVNGRVYEGWTTVNIKRSIKEMAGSFMLHVSQRFTGGRDGPAMPLELGIIEGDDCQIFYSGILAVTGIVDAVMPRYSKTHHSITIQGRSKSGDACDSSVEDGIPGGELNKVTHGQLIRKALQPFGLPVKVEFPDLNVFDKASVYPGETAHEFIERYSRSTGVCVTENERGEMRALQVEDGAPDAWLIEGVNLEEAAGMFRMDNRHSDYTVKGQNKGRGKGGAQVKAHVRDSKVRRHRPFTLLNEHKAMKGNARGRVASEAAQRSGESTRVEVKVMDWVHAPGKLWMPGMRVHVKSPMLRGLDRVLVIENVAHNQQRTTGKGQGSGGGHGGGTAMHGGAGTITTLALVPPEALNPKAGPKGGGNGGGVGADDGGGGNPLDGEQSAAPGAVFDTGARPSPWVGTKPSEDPQ